MIYSNNVGSPPVFLSPSDSLGNISRLVASVASQTRNSAIRIKRSLNYINLPVILRKEKAKYDTKFRCKRKVLLNFDLWHSLWYFYSLIFTEFVEISGELLSDENDGSLAIGATVFFFGDTLFSSDVSCKSFEEFVVQILFNQRFSSFRRFCSTCSNLRRISATAFTLVCCSEIETELLESFIKAVLLHVNKYSGPSFYRYDKCSLKIYKIERDRMAQHNVTSSLSSHHRFDFCPLGVI